MTKTDLHFHSHYSDGIYSPGELVKKLKEKKFLKVALTDHNTVDGVKEFLTLGEKAGLKAMTGVEIYTDYQGKSLHILGHGFDLDNQRFNKILKELQEGKRKSIKKAVKILQEQGWKVKEEDVYQFSASYYGIYHLAVALKNNNGDKIKKDFGVINNGIILINEIIKKYFFKDKKEIWPETRISTKEAIELIIEAGGTAVLAHPGQSLSWSESNIISELKKIGLAGLEAISSHHNWDGMVFWQKIAKENNLEITIGSDFHGDVPLEWNFKVRSQWEH